MIMRHLVGGISVHDSPGTRLEYSVFDDGGGFVGLEVVRTSSAIVDTASVYFPRCSFESIDDLVQLARSFLRLEVYPAHLPDVASDHFKSLPVCE